MTKFDSSTPPHIRRNIRSWEREARVREEARKRREYFRNARQFNTVGGALNAAINQRQSF